MFSFSNTAKITWAAWGFLCKSSETPPQKNLPKKINFCSGMQTKYLACGMERKKSCLRNFIYSFQLIEFVRALFCSTRIVTPKRIFSDDAAAPVVLECKGCVSTMDVQELQHSVTAPKICCLNPALPLHTKALPTLQPTPQLMFFFFLFLNILSHFYLPWVVLC